MTDRRFLTSEIISNSNLGGRRDTLMENYGFMRAQSLGVQRALCVPVYVCGAMRQLVQVNIAERKVKASFTFYASVFTELTQQVFESLQSNEVTSSSQLTHFLQNNLKLQIGGKYIDIFYIGTPKDFQPQQNLDATDNRVKLMASIRRVQSNLSRQRYSVSIQEEQQLIIDETYSLQTDHLIFQDEYFTKKLPTSQHARCTNHFISGIFDCQSQLNNQYFPYHQIYSKLNIRVHDQNYKDIMIKYNLIFPKEYLESNQQFYFTFPSLKESKFGIYSIDLTYHQVEYESVRDTTDQASLENQLEVTNADFSFKIFSFNIPFICRTSIPLWNLCFASLMLYFAGNDDLSNVYGNIILVCVSFIFLVTNFRRSKYRTSSVSLYELTITSFIVANFLLIIHSTNNFYGNDNQISDINSRGPFLDISIGLTSFAFFMNVLIMLIFAVKTFSPGKYFPNKSRQLLEDIWIDLLPADNPNQYSNRSYQIHPTRLIHRATN